MPLKEGPSQGWFPFLEALINFPIDGNMRVQFHVKNYKPIAQTGIPKLYTIQHRSSFMSRTNAITKILGSLHRLRRTVYEPILRICNVMELCVVYHQQGYSAGEQCAALRKLALRFPDENIWSYLPTLVEALLPP